VFLSVTMGDVVGAYVTLGRDEQVAGSTFYLPSRCFFLGLFFDTENVLPKRRFTINGLHDIISRKIEFFL
jgi:hypothetical protein